MYRVINVASREILSDSIDTIEQARIDATESETHETEPEVVIEQLVGDEWVATT